MIYQPVTENTKRRSLEWLRACADTLNGKTENPKENEIFETPEGDVSVAKDLIGTFLATLSGKSVKLD